MSSRTLPTGYAALAQGRVFSPVFLVELQWPTGTVYFWNGYGTISWDGHTFTGTGHMGTLSPIGESRDLKANGVMLSLSGIPTELVTLALADDTQGSVAKIWLAPMAQTGAFAADPLEIFEGIIDVCPIEDSGDTCTINVQLERELIDRRINNRRYTHEDQQIDYPGDMFFEFVAGLVDKEVTWGAATQSATGLPAGALYPTAVGMVQFE